MKNQYNRLFEFLPTHPLPENLCDRIRTRALRLHRSRIFNRFVAFSIICWSSFLALFPLFSYVREEYVQSGFLDFASLGISNPTVVQHYWSELGLAMLETLPVFGSVLLLGVFALFIHTLRGVVRDMPYFFKRVHNS